MLWRCWFCGRKGIQPVKTELWVASMVICLEQGVDLHIAQLMPLPLAVSCFSKIQISFTFLVPAHPGSPVQRAVKRVCVLYKLFPQLCIAWQDLMTQTQCIAQSVCSSCALCICKAGNLDEQFVKNYDVSGSVNTKFRKHDTCTAVSWSGLIWRILLEQCFATCSTVCPEFGTAF